LGPAGAEVDSFFIILTGNVLEYDESMNIVHSFDEDSCFCDAGFMTNGRILSTFAAGRRLTAIKITRKNLESITTSVAFLFRKIPMFASVVDDERFLKHCSTKKFKSGAEIAQLGDVCYYIASGSAFNGFYNLNAKSFFGHKELLEGTGIVEAKILLTSPTLLFMISSDAVKDPQFEVILRDLVQSDLTNKSLSIQKQSARNARFLEKSRSKSGQAVVTGDDHFFSSLESAWDSFRSPSNGGSNLL